VKKRYLVALVVLITASLACSLSEGAVPTPTSTSVPTNTSTLTPTETLTPSPIPDTPTPTPQVFVVMVQADIAWVDTGIDINPSQTIMITSTGTVNTWNGADISDSDADGQSDYICDRTDCAIPDLNYGTLVGRIGDGEPFRVGTSFVLTPPISGRLFLTVNDWEYFDNLREFEITITIP